MGAATKKIASYSGDTMVAAEKDRLSKEVAKLDGEIRGFLVERGMEGFSAPEMTGKHSLRASVTSELLATAVASAMATSAPMQLWSR